MATVYMNLDLPIVSTTLGPEWAELLNAALEVIDEHDHTAGRGRLITSAAININDDLPINGFNLEAARSYNMQNLGAPIGDPDDLRSLFAVAGELYYRDGVGNNIQITAGGALNAASVGGIGGDYGTSTASVYYSSISKTFFFDQDTDQRAKIDVGDVIIRDTSAASVNGITLSSPVGLAAPYQLTLPDGLPGSTLPLVVSSSGEIDPSQILEAMIGTDAVTNTKIQDGAVTTSKIADDNVTAVKIDPAANVVTVDIREYDGAAADYHYIVADTDVTHVRIKANGGGGGGGGGSNIASDDAGASGGAGAGTEERTVPVTYFTPQTFDPSDVDTSTETITVTGHGYSNGDTVGFSGADLPDGIIAERAYYIISATTDTFQISLTSGGAAVNLLDQGTGTHTVTEAYVVKLGAGGSGGGLNTSGAAGAETQFRLGSTVLARWIGAQGGAAGGGGTGGASQGGTATWEGYTIPSGKGSDSATNNSTNGSNSLYGGTGGADGTNPSGSNGGGGGASIGDGGAGGTYIPPGSPVPPTAGTKGSGGGGGNGSRGSINAQPGAAGGPGYAEVHALKNINPA